MEKIISETLSTVKQALEAARENGEQAMDAAKHGVDVAKVGTERAMKTTQTTFLDTLHAITGFLTTMRKLDGDDVLGWAGLQRRSSPLGTIATFGAGIAVGAGVGLLLAPTSGPDLRK